MYPRWLRLLWLGAMPVLVLALFNYVTFKRHYSGRATFPWDFLGGYHAQSFGWYDIGGVTAPASWLPWTNLGFPAFLAIQAGGWYLPLTLLHALGVEYSVHVATVFQALHVLFGAVGCCLLLRRLGSPLAVALFAGIAYHYGATFFSNQQHVDIVRAAAWFPWLILALHPEFLTRKWWGIPAAALILSQLLVCAYPGAIVSFAYASAVWVLLQTWQCKDPVGRRRYLVLLSCAVLCGLLMAMPKWMPFLLNGAVGLQRESFDPPPVGNMALFTFLLPYLSDAVPGDPTMRSLWLPLTVFWGICWLTPREPLARFGLAMTVFGLVFCMLVPHVPEFLHLLPGGGVSRFPLADWRPVIHLGLILASASGWQRLLSGSVPMQSALVRSAVMLLVFTAAVLAGVFHGFDGASLVLALATGAVVLALALVVIALSSARPRGRMVSGIWAIALIVVTATNGYMYHRSQPLTWRPAWNSDVEMQSFGGHFSDFTSGRQPLVIERRPARAVVGGNLQDAITLRDSSHYNHCYYSHRYCVFGYDNLRLSKPHQLLLSSLYGEGGGALLAFVSHPQQLLVIPAVGGDTVPLLDEALATAAAVGDSTGVKVSFRKYSAESVVYLVETVRGVRVIENEIAWPGWRLRLCDTTGRCGTPVEVEATSQSLRTWSIPPGKWTVNLEFVGPSNVPGYLCYVLGVLIALLGGWLAFRRKKAADGA